MKIDSHQDYSQLTCEDCGVLYPSFPIDFVLIKEQWLLIKPEDGGLLCGNCIAIRASKLSGVINLSIKITFAEDYSDGKDKESRFPNPL